MRLPDWLDYEAGEGLGPDYDSWPEVFCPRCSWRYEDGATWDDLADDGDVDWMAMHPDDRTPEERRADDAAKDAATERERLRRNGWTYEFQPSVTLRADDTLVFKLGAITLSLD